MTEQKSCYVLSRRAFALGATATLGSLLIAREAQAAAIADELLGGFKHAGGDKERRSVAAAIDEVVSGLSVIVRGVARERLVRANPVPPSLVLGADKRHFMISYASELFSAPLDGTPTKVRSSAGEEMELRVSVTKAGVDQVFSTDGKSRTNRLGIVDGKLAIDVIVRASELPRPLTYRLTYARS